jgi:hypothetical protein
LCAFEFGIGAYSVIQYHQSSTLFSGDETAIVVAVQSAYDAGRWAEITVIVLMVLGVITFTFLAYKLYLEFG